MSNLVYVVGLHDESWSNTGNFNTSVFKDKKLAEKQAEWLNKHLVMRSGDFAFVEEFEISETIDDRGEQCDIINYLMSSYPEEES